MTTSPRFSRLLMVLIAPLLATPLSAAVPAAFNQPADVGARASTLSGST
ncbi:hypothetical protein ACLBSJ_33430 [Klebsiella pneumoniae]